MKAPNEVKQNVKKNEGQIAKDQKVSNCCEPTCCGGSSGKQTSGRKDK